jgi:predicted  nucleic acid-binding Zn-ribbon protein
MVVPTRRLRLALAWRHASAKRKPSGDPITMPGPAVILKELHRLRRLIKDLDTKIEQAPKQLVIQQKKLAFQEEAFKQAQEHLKELAKQIREHDGNIKSIQQQILKYEKQLDSAANKKEYDTLKAEIASEKGHIAKHEDQILAMMGETEEKNALVPAAEKTVQKARADFAQFEKGQQERIERFAAEKIKSAEELKATEATLPEDVRLQYERLIAAKGLDTLSAVNGRICSACYTEITSQMLSELKREMSMLCKNCGRMLYLES